ncbi:MAG TPA: PilX N-terminal domain-containing pilus assembly protein [Solimonas sp.]|nr:PilX N-terminal domain-containing pilus assembly protein [Solimonas sp.]
MSAALRALSPRRKQQGAVLVVGLVVLLVLTLLSLSSIRSTSLEERMTNNTQDLQIAFQLAEAALREGEELLQQPVVPVFNNATGLYKYDPPDTDNPQIPYVPLWKRSSTQWINSTVMQTAAPPPLDRAHGQYLIEQLAVTDAASPGESLAADSATEVRTFVIYRITARGWGATGRDNPEPMVLLQSTFRR